MEITIGHSNHTSYVNFLVQKCMFEHKYDMDWKQSKVHTYWIKDIHTYVQPCLLKQSTKKHKIFKIFCMHQVYKIALFAWVPHMGSKHYPSSTKVMRSNGPSKPIGLDWTFMRLVSLVASGFIFPYPHRYYFFGLSG